MTRPAEDVEHVIALLAQGLPQAEVARRAGVPRATVRYWVRQGTDEALVRRSTHVPGAWCPSVARVPERPYAYLLGLYLGDGCISPHPKGVFRLRIALDRRYPNIIAECQEAMGLVVANKVGLVQAPGCAIVSAYSKHWTSLFPQHGAGPKHRRAIVLQPWQERIALDGHPDLLLRGMVHSDGYRGLNRIKGRYAYPRYLFSNRSDDIRAIYIEACRRTGIEAKPNSRWQVSVARHHEVAHMDTFIGPKG